MEGGAAVTGIDGDFPEDFWAGGGPGFGGLGGGSCGLCEGGGEDEDEKEE